MDSLVGKTFRTPCRTITEADIVMFAGLSGDYTRLHVDEEYARAGFFKGRIAHGLLTLAVTSGLWYAARIFEDRVKAFYGIDKLRFIRPVKIGDTICCELKVVGETPRGEDTLVEFESHTTNQRGEEVLYLQAKILLQGVPPRA